MNAFVRRTPCREAIVAFGLLVAAGTVGAQPPEPVASGSLEEVTATVTDIDRDARIVTLQSEDGREVAVEAGDEVRNFEQIEVGDRVRATFSEAIAAKVTEAPPGAEPAVITTKRAPVGGRPSGSVGLVYTAVVTIDSVDPQTHTVHFTGPRGSREVTVLRPELQEFVARLKKGDRVEVTYSEAMAVELVPEN